MQTYNFTHVFTAPGIFWVNVYLGNTKTFDMFDSHKVAVYIPGISIVLS